MRGIGKAFKLEMSTQQLPQTSIRDQVVASSAKAPEERAQANGEYVLAPETAPDPA